MAQVRQVQVRQVQVTFDCADPERVARFWCDVLGYDLQDGARSCVDPTGVGPRLYFQRVPEGKVVKNRVHLDVRVGTGSADTGPAGTGPAGTGPAGTGPAGTGPVGAEPVGTVQADTALVGAERLAALEAECARLLPLGATRVRLLEADGEVESCIVMQDVEGNEFCLD